VMERRPGASGTTLEGDDFEHGVKSRGKTRRGAGYTRGVKGSSGIPRPAIAPRDKGRAGPTPVARTP